MFKASMAVEQTQDINAQVSLIPCRMHNVGSTHGRNPCINDPLQCTGHAAHHPRMQGPATCAVCVEGLHIGSINRLVYVFPCQSLRFFIRSISVIQVFQ